MIKRILFGGLMIAFLGGIVLLDWYLAGPGALAGFSPLPLTVLTAGLVVMGYEEFRHLAASREVVLSSWTGRLGCLAVACSPVLLDGLAVRQGGVAVFILLGVVLLAIFLQQLSAYRVAGVIRRVGITMLGVAYLGVCGAVVLSIRTRFGLSHFVWFVAVVKCTDIGAYFTGKALGRHKLIEWLSPKKTWEGLIGGIVLAAAVSMALTAWYVRGQAIGLGVALAVAAGLGGVVGVFGQLADLCESAIKRDAGLKDAGAVVPEFGGVLDMLDSLLLSAPVAYVLLYAAHGLLSV